jgi:hypothetical protein
MKFLTGEDHLGAGDELLGVGQILVQGRLVPRDSLVLVRLQEENNDCAVKSGHFFLCIRTNVQGRWGEWVGQGEGVG